MFSLLIFFLSLIFSVGYLLGFNQSNSKLEATPIETSATPTPVRFVVNFKVTPYPPDESSWTKFNGITHFHTYTVKLPPNFSQISNDKGVNIFQDTNGNTIKIYPSDTYTQVKKADYTVGNFGANFDGSIKNGIEADKATIDLGSENLYAEYKGLQTNGYQFITIVTQLKIYEYSFPVASGSPYDISVITSNLLDIAYPNEFWIDQVYKDTKNCNGDPETILNFWSSKYEIKLDINKCSNFKSQNISSANEVSIANKKYVETKLSKDSSLCLISEDTKAIKYLLLYPLRKWTFAPTDTTINGKSSQLCLIPLTGTPLSPQLQKQAEQDFFYISSNIVFH